MKVLYQVCLCEEQGVITPCLTFQTRAAADWFIAMVDGPDISGCPFRFVKAIQRG